MYDNIMDETGFKGGHVIKIEYVMGVSNECGYEKKVMRNIFERVIKDPAFSDLTSAAVRDVLLTMLKDWNYIK